MRKKLEGDLNNDDILREIGSENPIKDFHKMINERREDLTGSAITQL